MFKTLWHKFLKPPEPQDKPEGLHQSQQVWWSRHGQETSPAQHWIVGDREILLEKETDFHIVSTFLRGDKIRTFNQFRVHSKDDPLIFSPILADRALLIQLKEPLWLLPGCPIQTTLLSPTWVRVCTADGQLLAEISSQAQRCSWSGSNPIQGDICYSSLVEMHFSPLTQWAHWQVMTPVLFSNEDKAPILVKEFLLPHPFLSLYLQSDGHLGTMGLHYHYEINEIHLKLNIEGIPEQAQLLGARKDSAHQLKMRHLLAFMQPS